MDYSEFIYFPFPFLPAILDGHYISSHYLFPLLLGSQCVYLFIFPFLSFRLFWMDTIYPVIFYSLCYSDHSVSTYLFSPFFPSFCSGWSLYVQLFSITYAARITVGLLIFFPFLYFRLFWMDTICPVIFYFLCYSDHRVTTYLFPLSYTSCCSRWTLYMQSFSISSATWISVSVLIYLPLPFLPVFLDGHLISSHFLFPLLLGSQRVYLYIFPFLSFLLFWMDTIYPVIFYFLCYSDHSVSTYLFSLSFTSCCSGWTLYIQSFSISSATRNTVCLLIFWPKRDEFCKFPQKCFKNIRKA